MLFLDCTHWTQALRESSFVLSMKEYMNTALWIIQALLGGTMVLLGIMKTFLTEEKLDKFGGGSRHAVALIRFIGISELLIGAGLVLPWLTGILPMLTSLAAMSLCIIMILAIREHVRHHERNKVLMNIIIFSVAAFVAVGRFVPLH